MSIVEYKRSIIVMTSLQLDYLLRSLDDCDDNVFIETDLII